MRTLFWVSDQCLLILHSLLQTVLSNIFHLGVVNIWSRLPKKIVNTSLVKITKNRLNCYRKKNNKAQMLRERARHLIELLDATKAPKSNTPHFSKTPLNNYNSRPIQYHNHMILIRVIIFYMQISKTPTSCHILSG